MALVNLSARLIEKYLFLRHFRDDVVFRFHARPEFVNLQHDGAIALAPDATIVAADETAMQLLHAENRSALIGRPIDAVFDVNAAELIEPGAPRFQLLRRRAAAGARCGAGQALLCEPGPWRDARARVAPAGEVGEVMQVEAPAGRRAALTLEELAGEDPQMLRNVRSAYRIAKSRVPVMIEGPTGSGKEVFARALHAASDRAARPFVALNCAAIPESLIESELFGYRRALHRRTQGRNERQGAAVLRRHVVSR